MSALSRYSRSGALGIAAIVLSSCISLPGQRTLASHRITGKTGEDTLLSGNLQCRVTPQTFARVQIGDHQTCVWEPWIGREPADRGRGGTASR
jgi:hypothetical protein